MACSSSSDGPAVGVAPEPQVGAADTLPGVVVEVVAVRGGSGPGGNVRSGDTLEVDFTVATGAGEPLELSTFARGAIMVSGPTFNYQRVIASQSDLRENSRKTALGAYTYRFSVPVPMTYLAPLNDTASFGEIDGELTGQPLLAGTYTVAIEARKDYEIDGETHRDPGNGTGDFLLGSATTLAPREVVTLANCNQCHGELKAHGENRNGITNCLVCHTAGSEDGNDPTAGNGTPGVSVDFKSLIHKIHAGASLPSVNGVTTNPDGSRNYDATPQPFIVQGYRSSLHDYSEVVFPVWPSMASGMPRDAGYGALTSSQRSQEDAMLSGPVDCAKCHGDPDGAGPLPAPAQGDLAYAQPTVQACISCHDDWVLEHAYTANGQTMPIQRDNASCKDCHRVSGTPLDVVDAHRHPLLDAVLAPGIVIDVESVTDVGGTGNGRFEIGESVRVRMTIKDGAGADIDPSTLSRLEAILSGPTTNPVLLGYVRLSADGLGAGGVHEFNVPANYFYESVGNSSTAGSEVFATANAPHWSAADTTVLLRSATGSSSTLAAPALAAQNWLDVATGTGSSFADGDYVVIDDGMPGVREHMRVRWVDGDRLWFSSAYNQDYAPGLVQPHTAGASVDVVTVTEVPRTDWSLDASTGMITETAEFGTGEVLVTYLSDWVVPATYPATFNESPDLGQGAGDWVGLPLLDGTYSLAFSASRSFTVTASGENTSYREASDPSNVPLLFGAATTIETVARIDSDASCRSCHGDIQFHGGHRRGYATCIQCHGLAGAEDAARYVYPSAAATSGVTIDFRTMLHKIHHGKDLANASSYAVVGFFGRSHTYEHVGFPSQPGGTLSCVACHGENNDAWTEPADRTHPMAGKATRAWAAVCASCHDSTAAQAHIDVNTSSAGLEACAICHGPGQDEDVRLKHVPR